MSATEFDDDVELLRRQVEERLARVHGDRRLLDVPEERSLLLNPRVAGVQKLHGEVEVHAVGHAAE